MRANEASLLTLVAAGAVLFVAVAAASWWIFGAGFVLLMVGAFAVDPGLRRRAMARRGVVALLVAVVLLVALNALFTLMQPTNAAPGRGVSLGGGWVEVAAALVVVAVVALVVVLFWAGLWRAIEQPRERWRTRLYVVALAVFVLGPAVVVGAEFVDPGARIFRGFLYVLAADAVVAAALPHVSRAWLASWGLVSPDGAADDAGNA